MRQTRFILAASSLLIAALAQSQSAQAKPLTAAVPAGYNEQRRELTAALIMNSAFTSAALRRADEVILQLRRDVAVAQAARDKAQREHSSLVARYNANLLAQQERFIAETARRDREFAVAKDSFVMHIASLLNQHDRRVDAALKRYADGDASVLDSLAELGAADIEARREAREAAKREIDRKFQTEDGEQQRSIAAVFSDAADKGQKPVRTALDQWLTAARIDPDDFQQWVEIFGLAWDLDSKDEMIQAAHETWQRAVSLDQRVTANKLCGTLAIYAANSPCREGWGSDEHLAEQVKLLHENVAQSPTDGLARLNLAMALTNQFKMMSEDDRRRAPLVDEAISLITALNRDFPNNIIVQYSEINILEFAGRLNFGKGGEGDRSRKLIDDELQFAKDALAARPTSSKLKSGVVDALMLRSEVSDFDRDEVASKQYTSMAIEIARDDLSKAPDATQRVHKLWGVLTRAAMSAQRYDAFERERDYYRQALELGRPFQMQSGGYMYRLTLPRLQIAELVLGNLDSARALARDISANEDSEVAAKTISAAEYASDQMQNELRGAWIDWIAMDYPRSQAAYRRIIAELADPNMFKLLDSKDRLFGDAEASLSLIVMAIEQRHYDDAITAANAVRKRMNAAAREPELTASARLLSFAFDFLIAQIPGSGIDLKNVTMPSFNGQVPSGIDMDEALAAKFLERRRAAVEQPVGKGTRQDRIIASFRATLDVATELQKENPSNVQAIAGMLSAISLAAHAGDPDVPWQRVAETYLEWHCFGWIQQPGTTADMNFALARAALLRHRAAAVPASGKAL